MPETSRADNMVPRRLFSIIIRLVLIALGILLMWRMVAMLANIPNFDDWPTNENKLEKHGSLKPDIVSDHSEPSDAPATINIKVYYESMCPDSKYFINHQLIPTIKQLHEIVNFNLIPYGKAKTFKNTTGIYFTCQHFRLECEGNKFHACAVKHIKNQQKLLQFVSCLFRNMRNPPKSAQSCTNEVGADWETMQKCATTNEGSELLKMHGEDTHNLNPSVTFIPTILLNNSQRIQKDILKDLKKEVCSEYTLSTGLKPESCL